MRATAAGPANPTPGLDEYLTREMAPPDPSTLAAIDAGPMDLAGATTLGDLDTLLDPRADLTETGWGRLANGVGYIAVRTPMPGVSAEMVDWWFDWHPRDPLRYRIWCPPAHQSTSFEPAAEPGAKPFWGTVHYPVEDIGVGMQTIRIAFQSPSRLGFSTDALDDPRVGTVVGGVGGDPERRMQATLMVHVFLREGDGLVLRSRFWLGALLRPDAPAPIAAVAAKLLNRPAVRRRVIPARIPYTLARHCAIEYAHLASLLPELHARYAIAWDAPA
jgi:phloretin hydrolase